MGKSFFAINAVVLVLILGAGYWFYQGDQRSMADLRQANQTASDQLRQTGDQLKQAQDKVAAADTKNQALTQQLADANKLADDNQKKLSDALAKFTAADADNQALTKKAADATKLVADTQKQLDAAQTTNETLKQKIDNARTRAQILSELVALGTDKLAGKDVTSQSLTVITKITSLNDPKLNQMLVAAADPAKANAVGGEVVTYLMTSISDSLQ